MGFLNNPNIGGSGGGVTKINGKSGGDITLIASDISYNNASSGIAASHLNDAVDRVQVKPVNYLYIGKHGNDSTANGSASAPYLTVSKALTVASSGTTLFIFPGTYTENLTLKGGVNLTSPIRGGTIITGNHKGNFSGTVIINNVILNSTSGITLQTYSILGTHTLYVLNSETT